MNGFELLRNAMRPLEVSRFLWDWQAARLKRDLKVEEPAPRAELAVDDRGWRLQVSDEIVARGRALLTPREAVQGKAGTSDDVVHELVFELDRVDLEIRDGKLTLRVRGAMGVPRSVDGPGKVTKSRTKPERTEP